MSTTLVSGVLLYSPAPANAADPAAESQFATAVNQTRAAYGRQTLVLDGQLVVKARAWAAHMAATNCLCHSTLTDGVTVSWTRLGENVGRGPSVPSLHAAFINSPAHFANMIDPRFNRAGYGVAYGGGQMWVAEVFMQTNAAPTPLPSPMIGSVDTNTCATISGWTLNTNNTGYSDGVHIYFYKMGTDVGSEGIPVATNVNRSDVNTRYKAGGNHGFKFAVPAKWRGIDHRVLVYGIDRGGLNKIIGGGVVNCSPKGSLDSDNCSTVVGWAQDRAYPSSQIDVHLYYYVNNVFQGNIVTKANKYRADVGSHGFSVAVPANMRHKTHSILAYAVTGRGNNPLIGLKVANCK